MLLSEIILVPPQSPGIPYEKLNDIIPTQVFTVEGNPVFDYHLGEEDHVLILKLNDQPAAALVFNTMMVHETTYTHLLKAETLPSFKGKGLAIKMIIQMRRWLDRPLMVDERLTPDGVKMWKKLANGILPVVVYDFVDDKKHPVNNIPDDQLYTTDEQKHKYVFIVEQLNEFQRMLSEQGKGGDTYLAPMSYVVIEECPLLSQV